MEVGGKLSPLNYVCRWEKYDDDFDFAIGNGDADGDDNDETLDTRWDASRQWFVCSAVRPSVRLQNLVYVSTLKIDNNRADISISHTQHRHPLKSLKLN